MTNPRGESPLSRSPQIVSRGRQCGRKARFDSETDASIAMVVNHGRRPDFNVYLCPHCEYWHVGHRPRDVEAA